MSKVSKAKQKQESTFNHGAKGRIKRLYFTGFSMGMADLVPGVSGGTIAFLFGIYDELLFSIKAVTGKVLKLALKGKLLQAIAAVPFGFLVPLMLGILTAIFGMVGIVTYLLEQYPVLIWSAFFGLVIGSAYVVSKRVTRWNYRRILLLVLGFIVTYVVVGLPNFSANASPLVIFATGAVASCAMILPGISGSLIMVILGHYKNVLTAVASRDLLFLAIFASGIVVGLGLFSRLLSWLLRVHRSGTIVFLIGVMLGSLRKVWPWQIDNLDKTFSNVAPQFGWQFVFALIIAAASFVLVWKLEQLGFAKDHIDIDSKDFKKELAEQHD